MERGVDRSTTEMIPLTAREREVAELIAEGLTNAEIAERLNLTFATSKWHVSQVLAKLEVDHREAVAPRLREVAEERPRRAGWRFGFGSLLSMKALGTAATVVPIAGVGVFGAAVFWTAGSGETPVNDGQPPATSTSSPLVQRGFDTVEEARAALIPADPDCARDPGWAPHANFSGCDFSGYFFGSANLNEATFHGASLEGANFSLATVAGVNFRDANLRNVVIRDAIAQGADFSGADLTGADFSNTIVSGAIWGRATCPDGRPSSDYEGTCVGSPGLESPPTTRSYGVPDASVR